MAEPTAGDYDGQDRRIEQAFARERGRLWRYIRSRMREETDAEDVLQDVFYELVVAYRLMRPIEHLSGWLFQVARNRIADQRRRRATRRGSVTDSRVEGGNSTTRADASKAVGKYANGELDGPWE